MELTKWLAVWETCPELKPDGLEYEPSLGRSWQLRLHDQSARGTLSDLDTKAAAALIRDKAVWWLATEGNTSPQIIAGDCFCSFSIRLEPATDGELASVTADDPTEALYLACCKVLSMTPAP